MVKMVCVLTTYLIGLFGTVFFASAITARARASSCGPSDHHQMVVHLHEHAVMGAAGQIPHAVSDFVGLYLHARLTHIVGHLNICGHVGLTSLIAISSVGKPACFCVILVGNCTPPKSL